MPQLTVKKSKSKHLTVIRQIFHYYFHTERFFVGRVRRTWDNGLRIGIRASDMVSRELLIGRKGPVTCFITFVPRHAPPRPYVGRQMERADRRWWQGRRRLRVSSEPFMPCSRPLGFLYFEGRMKRTTISATAVQVQQCNNSGNITVVPTLLRRCLSFAKLNRIFLY